MSTSAKALMVGAGMAILLAVAYAQTAPPELATPAASASPQHITPQASSPVCPAAAAT
jgi:hypothetical protein